MSDIYNYFSPARVQVLVVPFNGCSEPNFLRYFNFLKSVQEVRLLDLKPDPHLQHFNPQEFPRGSIYYEYSVEDSDPDRLYLHDFEPFRKTFIVLGVGTFDGEKGDTSEIRSRLNKRYTGCVYHDIIFFDTPDETIGNSGGYIKDEVQGTFYHNGSIEHNITALETIMCDITSNFLTSLDKYVSSSLSITLRSPVFISNSQVLAKTITRAEKSLNPGSGSLKISFQVSENFSTASTGTKQSQTQRQQGRVLKLLANYLMLAGKFTAALDNFIQSSYILKKCEDYLWLGSALEGISISILLLQNANIPYSLPNTFITQVLELSKYRISSYISGMNRTEKGSTDRNSFESMRGSIANNISSSATSNKASARNSFTSPGGSISSFSVSTNANNNQESTIKSWPLLEVIKLLFMKTHSYYDLSNDDYENAVPDLIYVDFLLRFIFLMVNVYQEGNEISVETLERLIFKQELNERLPKKPAPSNKHVLSKSYILNIIGHIFSLQLVDLPPLDQSRIYCGLALAYDKLGLERKRAFILRILLVCVLPKLEKESKLKLQESSSKHRGDSSGDSRHIRSLLHSMFSIYGIDIPPERSIVAAFDNGRSQWVTLQVSIIKLAIQVAETICDIPFLMSLYMILLTRYLHCLNKEDQSTLMKKHFSLSERYRLKSAYCDSHLVREVRLLDKARTDLKPTLSSEGPIHSNALLSSDEFTKGATKSKEVSADPFIFNPFNTQKQSISTEEKLVVIDTIYYLEVHLQNPFAFEVEVLDIEIVSAENRRIESLFSQMCGGMPPKSSNSGTDATALFQKMPGSIKTKQNSNSSLNLRSAPNSSQLQASGTDLRLLTLEPNSISQVIFPFKILDSGPVTVSGLNVSIRGFGKNYFKICSQEKLGGLVRIKNTGLKKSGGHTKMNDKTELHSQSYDDSDTRAHFNELRLKVLPEQPNMVLTSISIANNLVMLLDGERYEFSVELTNESRKAINYLSFSFWDSTLDILNKKLLSSNLSAIEIHDIEWYLFKEKPFQIMNKDVISQKFKRVNPGKNLTIDYVVNARKGLSESKLILEYAASFQEDSSLLKHVQIPLNFTVYPCLSIVGFDALPMSISFLSNINHEKDSKQTPNNMILKQLIIIQQHLTERKEISSDYTLLLIDIKNSWREDVQLQLNCQASVDFTYAYHDTIPSRSQKKFILPVKKIKSHEVKTEPIPSLRNKQFVKNNNISETEQASLIEIFWIRQMLLGKLSASWTISKSEIYNFRRGQLDFKKISITSKIASNLTYSKVGMENSIVGEDDPSEHPHREGQRYFLKANEFYTFKTKLINNTDCILMGTLQHIPYPILSSISQGSVDSLSSVNEKESFSIERKVFLNGLHKFNLPPEGVAPHSEVEYEVSFVMVEKGEYEWGSLFEADDHRSTNSESVTISVL